MLLVFHSSQVSGQREGNIKLMTTSVALRTVSTLSPIRMPFRPAQATSVTFGSAYTTKPYLQDYKQCILARSVVKGGE